MAAEVYTFKITYQELEDKIWRLAEVSSKYTLDKLGYMVLATFDTMAYHLFEYTFRDKNYYIPDSEMPVCNNDAGVDMATVKLEKLDLKIGDVIQMDYDFGTTQTFSIELVSVAPMKKGAGRHYPWILDGAGRGIIDDCDAETLAELIKQIDKNGHTDEPIYYNENCQAWDYREYSKKYDNYFLKDEIERIACGYEPFWE